MARRPSKLTEFLNVDLDLRVAAGLDRLLAAMKPEVFVLDPRHPDGIVSVEIAPKTNTLEETVLGLVGVVRTLPPAARAIWDCCDRRSFNIGIQAADAPHSAEFQLSPAAVAAVAGIGAEIVITVYAPIRMTPKRKAKAARHG